MGGLPACRIEKQMSLADHEIVRILEKYTETVQLPVMRRGAMKKIWVSAFGFIFF